VLRLENVCIQLITVCDGGVGSGGDGFGGGVEMCAVGIAAEMGERHQ